MLTLRLPTVVHSIRAIQPALSGLPGWMNMSAGKQHDVVLVATELVTNAIIHGNKGQAERTVMLNVDIGNEEIVIVVVDEGSGFDPAAIADPTTESNRELPSGRGLWVVRNLVETLTVDCADNQCRVTITMRLS
ncbi:MAG: ATP-binding protein [Candidatus Kapaibacterium sp.]